MATWYGQTPGDVIVGDTNNDAVPEVLASGATLTIWSLDKSTQITDLLDKDSNPVTVVETDAKGRAIFAQPADNAGSVWGRDEDDNDWLFIPNDLAERIGAGGGGASSWDELTGKPTTFTPTAHTHAQSDVTGLTAALAAKADDTDLANYLPKAGGAVTGDVTVPDPATGDSVVPKSYVDEQLASVGEPVDLSKTPVDINYNEATGTWPLRNTVTTDLTRRAFWNGPESSPPPIGGGYAVDKVDKFDAWVV